MCASEYTVPSAINGTPYKDRVKELEKMLMDGKGNLVYESTHICTSVNQEVPDDSSKVCTHSNQLNGKHASVALCSQSFPGVAHIFDESDYFLMEDSFFTE